MENGVLFFYFTAPVLGYLPPQFITCRLATDMLCLLWQSLKFKMVKFEAIAQGATVWNFLLAPTQNWLPRAIGQPLLLALVTELLKI